MVDTSRYAICTHIVGYSDVITELLKLRSGVSNNFALSLQHLRVLCRRYKPSYITGFRSSVAEALLFWDATQRGLVVGCRRFDTVWPMFTSPVVFLGNNHRLHQRMHSNARFPELILFCSPPDDGAGTLFRNVSDQLLTYAASYSRRTETSDINQPTKELSAETCVKAPIDIPRSV